MRNCCKVRNKELVCFIFSNAKALSCRTCCVGSGEHSYQNVEKTYLTLHHNTCTCRDPVLDQDKNCYIIRKSLDKETNIKPSKKKLYIAGKVLEPLLPFHRSIEGHIFLRPCLLTSYANQSIC